MAYVPSSKPFSLPAYDYELKMLKSSILGLKWVDFFEDKY
jgi:hypothetical protein